jgi:hypothetical protein
MGHKIFVSYKYGDTNVAPLAGQWTSTVRDYVSMFEGRLDRTNHVCKGESDGEDLSYLTEDTIWAKLRDRIYDSSVTIVFISPWMKENRAEIYQWIPWEISYSLKETTRGDRTSHANAVFAVVLPDRSGSYEYFMQSRALPNGERYMYIKRDWMFPILRNNMFNRKRSLADVRNVFGMDIFYGEASYIFAERWDAFIGNISANIDRALRIQHDADSYNIIRELSGGF